MWGQSNYKIVLIMLFLFSPLMGFSPNGFTPHLDYTLSATFEVINDSINARSDQLFIDSRVSLSNGKASCI